MPRKRGHDSLLTPPSRSNRRKSGQKLTVITTLERHRDFFLWSNDRRKKLFPILTALMKLPEVTALVRFSFLFHVSINHFCGRPDDEMWLGTNGESGNHANSAQSFYLSGYKFLWVFLSLSFSSLQRDKAKNVGKSNLKRKKIWTIIVSEGLMPLSLRRKAKAQFIYWRCSKFLRVKAQFCSKGPWNNEHFWALIDSIFVLVR